MSSPQEAAEQASLRRQLVDDALEAARRYREREQDGTPRAWRGKELQDLAASLDDALEALDAFDNPEEAGRGRDAA